MVNDKWLMINLNNNDMKNILVYCIIASLFLTSCMSALNNKIAGNGDVSIEERTVTPFDEIDIDGVFKVYLTQGDTEKVEVEIDENLQQYVKVFNKGNTLVLDIEKGINWGKTVKNNVYITLKNINKLSIDGVCSVQTNTILICDHLKLDIDGVSSSSLELKCNRLVADLSGVGSSELSGEANEFTVSKDGVGSLKARNLIAAIVNISNSGVGSAEIYASQELSMKNSGVGSITYYGEAVIKSMDSSGVGKIRKAD